MVKNSPEYKAYLKKVGNKLRDLRRKAGYTSYDHFAWEHKLPRTGYAYMEQGKNFKFTTLLRILEIHGITPGDFFGDIK